MILLLAVIYIVFISLGLPDSLFGVAWPVVHTEFGINEGFASVYSVVTGVCTGGVSFFAGRLLRKFGTGPVTFVSIILTVIGIVGMSFSPNIAVMMLFAVILGYGAGAIDTGLNNFVSLHYKAHHMNWLHCFWGVGVTASPLIMSAFLSDESGSWRAGYRVIAVIQLSIAALVLFSLKRWKKVENEAEEKSETEEKGKDKTFFEILKIKGAITGILSLGFYCAMEFLLGTWGASYLVNVYSLTPDAAAKWVSLYYGGIMLGRFVSGFAALKLSDKALIRGGIGFALAGIAVLALPLGKASICGFLLIGMGFGPIFPSVLHSVPDRFGHKYSADLTGFHMGGAYAVGFGAQLLFGYTASATTFKITPYVLMAFCILLIAANEITVTLTSKSKSGR